MIAPSKVLVADGASYPKQSTTNSCAQVYSNATHPMLHGAQRGVLVSTATDHSRQFDQNHLFLRVCRAFVARSAGLEPATFSVRSDRVSGPIDPRWSPSAPVYGVLLGRRCH